MQNREHHRWKDKWKGIDATVNPFAKRAWKFLRREKRKALHLLDLGCGDGTDSLFFARKGLDVTGVDFSESGLNKLRKRVSQESIRMRVVKRDLSKKLPFPDSSFDVVYAHLSLHYFDHAATPRVFREVHRVLKRGGVFFVKCKSVDDALFGKGRKIGEDTFLHGHVRHFFSKDYMSDMLRPFTVLMLKRSSSVYHSYKASYIESFSEK